MDIDVVLNTLTSKIGVSGAEDSVAECALDMLRNYCNECEIDRMGNVVGVIRGDGGGKKIMLESHMDQVGFIVTDIDDDGNICFAAVGGIDVRILPCLRVKICGSKIIDGVILSPSDEDVAEKNPDIKKLRIFTGYSKSELLDLVTIGDIIVFDNEYMKLSGDCRCSAAMDNRSGMAVVLTALEYLKQNPVNADVYAVFSTQEEVGLRGAYTGTYGIEPDMAIVVDVTHGTTVDSTEDSGVFDLGSGAAILRGPNVNYHMAKELIKLADENNIDYKIETAGGASGTTAWAIQTVRAGVPVLLISIPLRYMHTNVEVLDLKDVEKAGRLMGIAAVHFAAEVK